MTLSKEAFPVNNSGEQPELFSAISDPYLRDYLESVDTALQKQAFPVRYTFINSPLLTEAFGMERPAEMYDFMKSLRMAGLVIPETRKFKASGRINRAAFYEREQLQVAAVVYWTIVPQLTKQTPERFKQIDWNEVYEEAHGYIAETSLADVLTKPEEKTEQQVGPGIVDNEKPVITLPEEQEKTPDPGSLAFWDRENLGGALYRLSQSLSFQHIMPGNIAQFIIDINYRDTENWTLDQLERGIELSMEHLRRFPEVENLHDLMEKIRQLQQEKKNSQ